MNEPWRVVLAHGGAGSREEYRDGAETACRVGFESMQSGAAALDAACLGVTALESDGRFNAGVGSRRRSDGSVQTDAACMDSGRRFGAVAAVTGFRHPIKIAQALTACPQHLLVGPGAAAFAHNRGMEVWTPETGDAGRVAGCDTVGCVAFDGDLFAAALSTGGTGGSPPGRVGDVPLLGCGLYAGPYGAVVATGLGEAIVLNMTAFRAYQMLEEGMGPRFVLDEALGWFKEDEDIGLLLVSRKGYAGGASGNMAWAALEAGERE